MKRKLPAVLAAALMALAPIQDLGACTRVVYLGRRRHRRHLPAAWTGWGRPFRPLGVSARPRSATALAGPKAIDWTSKYGSVVTAAFVRRLGRTA